MLLEEADRYRRLIDKLIYLTVTCPNISFAVRLLSQFMHEPRQIHWQGALRVLTYIKNSSGKDLIYSKHGHLQIEIYSNSDYAGDQGDRKSTSSYCTFVGG